MPEYITSNNSGWSGGGGGGVTYGGGGGGDGGSYRAPSIDFSSLPSMLNGWYPGKITTNKDDDMAFTNPQAAEIAREILDEETKGKLRERVTEAVATLREQITGAACGSVFSFRKDNDQGKHYWYAAIKNGDKWYTTAGDIRGGRLTLDSDEDFITWLIGLEVYDSPSSTFALGPKESIAIEASAT